MDVRGGISARLRRLAMALAAFCALAMVLVGCQQSPLPGQSNNGAVPIEIITPNPGQLSPTPTFPPFTVGTWPSNFSPHNSDTITIYVYCRMQPADMAGPSTPPPAGLQVQVDIEQPSGSGWSGNLHYSGTTDAQGLAAVPITFDDKQSGTPVVVDVHVSYNSQSYFAKTFFTPNPTATPTPTPKAGKTPTPTP